MPNPPPTHPVQLRLPTGDPVRADDDALTRTGLHLLAIQDACQLVQDIAAGRVELDDNTVDELRRALNTLDASGPLPGRLGYLTRLLNTAPVTNYGDLVDELAFAVDLNNQRTP